MHEFLLGGISIGSFAAGLFFLQYWRASGDRFFLYFLLAFWIEAANRFHMALTNSWNEDTPVHYLVRLASYTLILLAIADKNRHRDD